MDRIAQHVDDAEEYVDTGLTEIIQATEYKAAADRKKMMLFGALALLAAFFIAYSLFQIWLAKKASEAGIYLAVGVLILVGVLFFLGWMKWRRMKASNPMLQVAVENIV